MLFPLPRRPNRILTASAILCATALGGGAARSQDAAMSMPAMSASGVPGNEALFLSESDQAMRKMMNAMAAKPGGDVDRDFVAMMAPHHQGAIEMALALLRYGSNEKLKRLAQEIIVTQQQEIAAMRLAVAEPLPASKPSPTQIGAAPNSPK